MDLFNVVISFLTSLFASFLFWLLSFKISLADITFSAALERSKNVSKGPYHRYRVRIANLGLRDLTEITIAAKLTIMNGGFRNVTHLAVGNQGSRPVLHHRPLLFHRDRKYMYTIKIELSELTMNELKKNFYPKKIIKLAEKGTISLDDIFAEFGDRVSIQVYVYGNDRTTGARRFFMHEYTRKDIVKGNFLRSDDISPYSLFGRRKQNERRLAQIDLKR